MPPPSELLAQAVKRDRFNQWLVNMLDAVNHIVAGAILIVGGFVALIALGTGLINNDFWGGLVAIAVIIISVLLAVMASGVIALLLDIRDNLIAIKSLVELPEARAAAQIKSHETGST